jgi:phage head maturation protease
MPSLHDIQTGLVQVRAAVIEDLDAAKGEVYARVAPYGVEADIGGGIIEEFRPGTFARAVKAPDRLSVWSSHGGPLVGRGIEVEDKLDGIWVRAKLGRTQAARDMVLDFEDGILRDPSIEFRPLPEFLSVERRGDAMKVTHRKAHLLGFAMVGEGAYSGSAFVASMRDAEADRAREEARLWLAEFRNRPVTLP